MRTTNYWYIVHVHAHADSAIVPSTHVIARMLVIYVHIGLKNRMGDITVYRLAGI